MSGAGEEFHYIFVDCAHEADEEQTDHDFIVKPEDWAQLRESFLNHFMRGDYKSHLSRELTARKKLENESMIVYITAIQTLCHDLDEHMSSEQVIGYCLDGMEPGMASQIQYFNPRSVRELMTYAKNVEMGNERLKKSLGESSGIKNKKISNLQTENEAKIDDKINDKISDPILSAVQKLTETVNSLSMSRNASKNGTQKQNNGFKRNNYRVNNFTNKYNSSTNNNSNNNFRNNSNNNYNNYRQNRQFNNKFANSNFGNNFNGNNSLNSNFNHKNRNGIQCYNCGKFGHIKQNCRAQTQEQAVNQIESRTTDSNRSEGNRVVNTEQRIGANSTVINTNSVNPEKLILIDVRINGKIFKGLVDSGAELTLIRKSVAEQLKLKIIPYEGPSIESVDKNIIQTFGKINLELNVKTNKVHSIKMPVIIVDKLPADILLGIDWYRFFDKI